MVASHDLPVLASTWFSLSDIRQAILREPSFTFTVQLLSDTHALWQNDIIVSSYFQITHKVFVRILLRAAWSGAQHKNYRY